MLLFKTHEDQVLIDDPKRRQNERFWSLFARLYNQVRENGYTPKQTCKIICDYIGCKQTAYYTYLREARERGIISETHADTQALRVAPANTTLPTVVSAPIGQAVVIHGSPDWMMKGGLPMSAEKVERMDFKVVPPEPDTQENGYLGGFTDGTLPEGTTCDVPAEKRDTMEGSVGVSELIMFDAPPRRRLLQKLSDRFRALFNVSK